MNNLAILASGQGTNAENIIGFFNRQKGAQVVLVGTENRGAKALERAKRLKVNTLVFSTDELADGTLLACLQRAKVDFIVLAGFLKLIPAAIIRAFPRRIVNIHPALLPKYGGKGMYGDRVHRAVLANGEPKSGITIHYVNEVYDSGDVIFQATCPVEPDDTPETLAKRVHQLEYEHYPKVLASILNSKIIP